MRKTVMRITLGVGLLAGAVGDLRAQATHEIRMEESGRGEYRFVPAQVTARPGDRLVFLTASGAPHSVVFEGSGLSPEAHEALNAAMPRRSADLSSPVLTRNGAEYQMTVPAVPRGTYSFFCLPHRAYDMRGDLVVR